MDIRSLRRRIPVGPAGVTPSHRNRILAMGHEKSANGVATRTITGNMDSKARNRADELFCRRPDPRGVAGLDLASRAVGCWVICGIPLINHVLAWRCEVLTLPGDCSDKFDCSRARICIPF